MNLHRELLMMLAGEPLAMLPDAYAKMRALACGADIPGKAAGDDVLSSVGIGGSQAAVHPATERAAARRDGSVAVVPISGIIFPRSTPMLSPYERYGLVSTVETIVANIRSAVEDNGVKAVVLDVNSPGGNSFGLAEGAKAIFDMRGVKPIIAQSNFNMASAAYFLASQADEIIASPSAMVGSIGVYMVHEDWTKFNDTFGVSPTYISAGKYKVDGNPDAPLSETARATFQASVDESYAQFVQAVARARNVSESAVRDGMGEGRYLDARPALGVGLADKIRSMADTLATYGVSASSQSDRKSAGAYARRRADLDLLLNH
jgi:capsid assembly protease